jgi:hypothetical protein
MRRRRALRRRFNPYVAGTPVFDRQLFFGREAIARRALEALGSHSVQVTGERRIGKTSFLHHLQGLLAAQSGAAWRSFPVFVDLEGVAAGDLCHALMEEAVVSLAVSPRTLAELQFGRGRGTYAAADFACDVGLVVAELASRTPQPARLVLLIDEVDAVYESEAPSSNAGLGRLLETGSQELRVVLAGVGPFGPLEALELEPLAPGDAEALVREPVAGVFRYECGAVERILEASRLRPFAIQKLCLQAVDRMLDEGRTRIRVADVEASSSAAAAAASVQCN